MAFSCAPGQGGARLELLIVDDHPLFVEGFAAMLRQSRPDWRLTTAASGDEALRLLAGVQPDLVIIDIVLPDRDGFELLDELSARWPRLRAMLVSGRDRVAMRQRARASLARGFVSKTTPAPAFIAHLEAVLEGGRAFEDVGPSDAVPALTNRQAEILDLLAQGHGNKEIRYRLGIAERTVRAHLTELFNLLGVHGRMPAVIRARELGLIE